MEIELKYRARDDAVLARLAAAATLGPAALDPPRTFDELDRYLDTADGLLAAARWACRLRTRGGRTVISLKGPAAAERPSDPAALHRRPEVEGPATTAIDPAAWPSSEAREQLIGLARGGALVERLVLAQRRTERAVRLDGVRVGTLSLDRTEVLRAGERRGGLLVVELELTTDLALASSSLDALADALGALDGLEPDPATKLELALELVADWDA
ncbi:MAG: CYTH domain-containing protein [Chloroflexota bacterium]